MSVRRSALHNGLAAPLGSYLPMCQLPKAGRVLDLDSCNGAGFPDLNSPVI